MATQYHTVEMVQPDEAGLDFYLTRYKPFRLGALQTDTSCFSSTYAREASFTDDVWRDRLLLPTAKTFVAVVPETRAIVSSVTVVLGTPTPPELVSRLANEPPPPRHWTVNAVYTVPKARRQGIAEAVLAAALQHVEEEAASEGRSYLVTVRAAGRNDSAVRMYEKAGFVVEQLRRSEGAVGDGHGLVLLSLYKPCKP
ncbi:hypothetical protein HIM_11812 [Hirsutella minnesotensis 3608]|uniref:N-acetyltransferase domain-containing protein n=1 Tax=Hirsutella minnesotensis 3608 TaxID=1043627 RepID=A0A0F7ZR09_9HYPO|nr:hypothetical protein HIM_11812 [Hirsutella minnesotensis 3608]